MIESYKRIPLELDDNWTNLLQDNAELCDYLANENYYLCRFKSKASTKLLYGNTIQLAINLAIAEGRMSEAEYDDIKNYCKVLIVRTGGHIVVVNKQRERVSLNPEHESYFRDLMESTVLTDNIHELDGVRYIPLYHLKGLLLVCEDINTNI